MLKIKRKFRDTWFRLKSLNHVEENLLFETHRVELERSLLDSTESGVTDELECEVPLIVSLTSYGQRIEQVHLTIESLLRQTYKPNRIILWLGENERSKPVPAALKLQTKRGLEIRYTPDIGSYKKLIPALIEFPDSIIITVDDDMIYDVSMIDRLVRGHKKFPGCVITNVALKITRKPMRTWTLVDEYDVPDMNLLAIGYGGTLYPPKAFAKEVTDRKLFMQLCPSTDDVWFRVMAIRNGTKMVRVLTPSPLGKKDAIANPETQKKSLWQVNVMEDRNTVQFNKAKDYFKLDI